MSGAPTPPPPRLGTVLIHRDDHAAAIRQLIPLGYESFQLAWKNSAAGVDFSRLADHARQALGGSGAEISALAIYGNSLAADAHGDEVRATLRSLITRAADFGTSLVCCFAGRVSGRAIPESIERFREVFSELAAQAEDAGVRIAFENCLQGGTWAAGDRNIAHNPAAWELMFDAVPSSALGLEWEPAHQICQGIDPLPQLRSWASRIFHLHGKDAEIDHPALARYGHFGPRRTVWHRLPGFGITDWREIIRILLEAGYQGCIDIEGGHDPVFRGDRDPEGQLHALHHLRTARAAVHAALPGE